MQNKLKILLGIFRLRTGKIDCDIWNQHLGKNAKNCAKQKTKQFFGQKKPYLSFLGCKFEKILSYFLHPRICQNAKFRPKLKILNFGTKMSHLGVFRLQF